MSIENSIKQVFDEMMHNRGYDELRQFSETTCFEVVSKWSRFFNAYSGF